MRVRNTRRAPVTLCRFARPPAQDEITTQDILVSCEIAPGSVAEVDAAFLATDGAKALFADGSLVDVDAALAAENAAAARAEQERSGDKARVAESGNKGRGAK